MAGRRWLESTTAPPPPFCTTDGSKKSPEYRNCMRCAAQRSFEDVNCSVLAVMPQQTTELAVCPAEPGAEHRASEHITPPNAQGACSCQISRLNAASSGHKTCSCWQALRRRAGLQTLQDAAARRWPDKLEQVLRRCSMAVVRNKVPPRGPRSRRLTLTAAERRPLPPPPAARDAPRSVMGATVEEGLGVLGAQQRPGQAQELPPLRHVRAHGEVVVLVLLDAVQDLPVQDQRRPAGTGRSAEAWRCLTGDAAPCVDGCDSSRWRHHALRCGSGMARVCCQHQAELPGPPMCGATRTAAPAQSRAGKIFPGAMGLDSPQSSCRKREISAHRRP